MTLGNFLAHLNWRGVSGIIGLISLLLVLYGLLNTERNENVVNQEKKPISQTFNNSGGVVQTFGKNSDIIVNKK